MEPNQAPALVINFPQRYKRLPCGEAALNYVLAMSGVKFRAYLLGTLIGLRVPIALYCVFFDVLTTASRPLALGTCIRAIRRSMLLRGDDLIQ